MRFDVPGFVPRIVRLLEPGVVFRDVRYGLRTLIRSPGFTLVSLLALALGIGANTAVFSVVNAVLLRPLPYADPDRLVVIVDSYPQQGEEYGSAGLADFLDWKAQSRSFTTLDAFAPSYATLTGNGDAEQVVGMDVTSTFFETLGVRPLLGRAFAQGEDQPGRPPTVVLSERLWRRRYGSDPKLLGRQIVQDGRPATVVGIMPSRFVFGSSQTELWTPLTLTPPVRRGPFFLRGIARLKPGITREQAAAEMDTIAHGVERANPKDYTQLRFPVRSLRDTIVGDVRPLLWLLTIAVGLVLLIAISNVANLTLARATAREREVALRVSIGASRGQIVRQFLSESLMLSLAGGGCGIALAFWGIKTLKWLGPQDLPRAGEIAVDARVLAFTVLVSVLGAVLFGVAPALASSGAAPNEALKEGGRSGGSQRHGRARGALVIAQMSLSVVLLIGAGLLIRSFNLLGHVDLGFAAPPDRVLTMPVSPTGPRWRDNAALNVFWTQLLERVQSLPGVLAASIANTTPPDRLAFTDGYEIESKPLPPGSDHPAVPVPFVSHGYFKTLGIPLLRGRVFDQRDTADSPRVTVISATMARRHFPGEDPIGQRLKHGGRSLKNPWMEIVGIVGDAKYQGLGEKPEPVYYELSDQVPFRPMWLLVRTETDAHALAPAVREEIRKLDPNVVAESSTTMAEAVSESVSMPRFRSLLMTAFAAMALLLAAIGIYGVIAYSVAQRTQEIGVRMALGSSRSRMLVYIVGQGSRLVIAGIAVGLAGAFAVTRMLEGMLFGVTSSDAVTFTGAVLVLGAVAIAACAVPALRASRIDPIRALRHE
ncbi:MAG TPA: ABC transporter permease [Thermoanaerobaculia bacterium]|jgi:putative ABC transport system permease protein